MKLDAVRVGIVGLGLVAESHLKGYATHAGADVVAVCDLDRAKAEQFASQHYIKEIYTSYSEMLERADINTVDIATPTFLHASMTRQAAEAGMHIHCEKPFCRSVGEGLEACEVARQNDVKLLVGETYVFTSSHMKARELIIAGEIGRPLQIRQRHGAWFERKSTVGGKSSEARSWRVDGEKSGGGDYPWVFDHAVHFFSAAEYLMRDCKIDQVFAVTGTCRKDPRKRGASHDPYTVPTLDIPIITWNYADSNCQGVWIRADRLNGKYDFMRGFSTVVVGEHGMIEVLGEGGHNLLWRDQQKHLLLHREGKETCSFRFDEGGDDVWQSEISYYSQGHINQVHHLIDCIQRDLEPRYTGEDGVHAVKCTLSTVCSAREKRPVCVDEISPNYTAYSEK